MFAKYFVQILFALAGCISVMAAVFNWNWFFTAQNTQYLIRSIGRRKTRIVYGILGLILIGTSVYLFTQKS